MRAGPSLPVKRPIILLTMHLTKRQLHDALVIQWVVVFILVISQFPVIPMMAMITADTHRSVIHTVSSNDGHAGSNTTTAFKGPPELSP